MNFIEVIGLIILLILALRLIYHNGIGEFEDLLNPNRTCNHRMQTHRPQNDEFMRRLPQGLREWFNQ